MSLEKDFSMIKNIEELHINFKYYVVIPLYLRRLKMITTKTKKYFKRALSCVLAFVMTASMSTVLPAIAEEAERYPYVIFAADENAGISIDANGFTLNGNAHSNGEFSVASQYSNINGKITDIDDAKETEEVFDVSRDMILIHNKLTNKYFSENCVTYDESYTYSDMNMNINNPIYVTGKLNLDGNINLNNAIGAVSDIKLSNGNLNGNNTVIYSKFGDIDISGSQTSVNGLIYAPFGTVTISSENFNLNGIIIAQNVVISCVGNVNINFSSYCAEIVGTETEEVSWTFEDWEYLADTDDDEIPNIIEKEIGTDPYLKDTDGDLLDDCYEVFTTGTNPTLVDSDENGISDADEDFDEDGLTNIKEIEQGSDPYCDESIANMVFEKHEDGTIVESFSETTEATFSNNISLFSSSNNAYNRLMTIWEFEVETDDIDDDLENYFDSMYNKVISYTLYSDKESSFVRAWNRAALSDKSYNVCVINCHANPEEMYNGLTTDEVKKLERMDCECLILLGCNAGHYDYIWENLAYEFSKKVTGVVVASDGTVYSGKYNHLGFTQKFTSKNDDTYETYCNSTRKNFGWVVYDYSSSKKRTTWYSTGIKTITMKSILNYLIDCDLIYFY